MSEAPATPEKIRRIREAMSALRQHGIPHLLAHLSQREADAMLDELEAAVRVAEAARRCQKTAAACTSRQRNVAYTEHAWQEAVDDFEEALEVYSRTRRG